MKNFIKLYKKQNLGIKIGFGALAISILTLSLGLILLATAKFTPLPGSNSDYAGNGFDVINAWGGLGNFLSSAGYSLMQVQYHSEKFLTYPIIQVTFGIVFAVIIASTLFGVSILSLIFGYFKRWLYS